ncbi:unnamed protein product, partial [Haemonchus placei]|uniref:Endo/exonuclease/phosphatase domain-containing protein n=1 Tax=Haemonchus placei TaxID=6290 RepID=A0A0N4W414_HAEPC
MSRRLLVDGWGAFCSYGTVGIQFTSCKMTSQDDYPSLLEKSLVPFIKTNTNKYYFLQDNASNRTARSTLSYYYYYYSIQYSTTLPASGRLFIALPDHLAPVAWTTWCWYHGYAPTVTYSDVEYHEFLEQISEALGARFHNQGCIVKNRNLVKTVLGDFNAKIGCGEETEKFIGRHGLGVRNERGDVLANFCSENELYVMNNHFKKTNSRKWTWISPNMQTKNAIDFVLSADRTIFQDVDIIGRFKFVSDHRLVMAKIRLENKRYHSRKAETTTNFDAKVFSATLKRLIANKISSNYEELKEAVEMAAAEAKSEVPKKFHFSERTRNLFEKRHLLLHQQRSTVEFSMINKLLRLPFDLERKHLLRLQEAVSQGSSLRRALQERQI